LLVGWYAGVCGSNGVYGLTHPALWGWVGEVPW